MSSSTSSSEPTAAWARFLRLLLLFAAVPAAIAYAFIALVDPWGMLPLSLPLRRETVTTNQRFSYPMIAQDPRFDSVVVGTSTSRLLRPAQLDELFGARFANLSMNSGTAWEQAQLLALFTRRHPAPRVVMVGLDKEWCESGPLRRLTPRPFPEWMYGGNPWRGYGEILNPFAAEEAGKQALAMLRLARPRYGRDGYADFLPNDARYDAARAAQSLVPPPAAPAAADPAFEFPQHALLAERLAALPAVTRAVLFFVPYHVSLQPRPGTLDEQRMEACRAAITRIAKARPGTALADFMIPSPITREDTHYWDPQHYRIGIAERLARGLAAAAEGHPSAEGDYVLLVPPVGH
ncbi:hypothetical protein GXW74_05490 [Roseomonas eburnea]|uniref:Uncharacterized protein n=1 Tax=Neoroseomonas eburnea TaxID=1346889 RepID=A0A9X9X895_9PROT|nr:hypothetical protein [Neoroseomonas eburnea]MBR0679931.1 hypothetical protein [Neoroseomonas eburnea]